MTALLGLDFDPSGCRKLRQYDIYRRMLSDHFGEPEETAMHKAERFEREAKQRFVDEPGRMKLLIVVDKLLTGFDAPPATYLYIDKPMQDHGLFQAICRVNRLDGQDKEYGYVIDYKDLFCIGSLQAISTEQIRGRKQRRWTVHARFQTLSGNNGSLCDRTRRSHSPWLAKGRCSFPLRISVALRKPR